jgi:hypothetical protein
MEEVFLSVNLGPHHLVWLDSLLVQVAQLEDLKRLL